MEKDTIVVGTKEEEVLPIRRLGRTGLETSQLGFGTAARAVSDGGPDDDHLGSVLNTALDAGINFIDTASDYANNQERIGQYISHRRDQFYVATKCGCNIGLEGKSLRPDHLWTADRLLQNIDQSLKRMRTDYVDILQMHNPSVEEVKQGELVSVLEQIRQAGKTRFIGVSSTIPHLSAFVEMNLFDVFQVPYSALRRTHEQTMLQIANMGVGLIIRGGDKDWAIWDRAQLGSLVGSMSRYEFLLRFTLSHVACQTIIVGTAEFTHLAANVAAAQAGPLPAEIYREARERLAQVEEGSYESDR